MKCFADLAAAYTERGPAIPGFVAFCHPVPGRVYVMGCDPAEGNPHSDESALCVLDLESGEQVAELAGRIEPSTLADYADKIGRWYNNAPILVERQNHGHAVLLWLTMNSPLLSLPGLDGKPGWNNSELGKVRLYDGAADAFRHGETMIHSLETFTQLSSIEGSTLRAPSGEHDDRAMSYALALNARLAVYGALAATEG